MQRIPPRSGERWCASWPPVSTPTRSGGRFGSAGIPSTAGLGIRDWRAGGFDALVPKPVPVHAAHPGRGAGVGGGAAPREPGPYRWGDPTDPARPAGWRPHSVAWPGFVAIIEGCVDALIRVLVDLHSIDPKAVGLSDFGKPDGYLERQVRRWGSQWELVRLPDDHRDADISRLHLALQQAIPQQSRTSIVHGDYRIDNTILDTDDPCHVRAVVDWELSTLGDPLSDAALMCVYRDPALDLIVHAQAAWTSPLLPAADELADRYSLVSGQPLGHWEFYMALAYFKLAIIAAGIDYRRRMSEQAEGKDTAAESVPDVVAPLIARGLAEIAKKSG